MWAVAQARGLRLLLALAAAPYRALAARTSSSCTAPALGSAELADFNHGLFGWHAGNSSLWEWSSGCAQTAVPCEAASSLDGFMLAVSPHVPLTSPAIHGSCLSFSFFTRASAQLVVEMQSGPSAPWKRVLTLVAKKGSAWERYDGLALPDEPVRIRMSAQSEAGKPWVPRSVGLDDVAMAAAPAPAARGAGSTDEHAVLGADGWSAATVPPSPVGVDFSAVFSRQPIPLPRVTSALAERGIRRAKVFQYDGQLLDAMAAAGVTDVAVGIPNFELHALALSPTHADDVVARMEPHRAMISYVIVGNEPLADWWADEFSAHMPLAVRNVRAALRARGWHARATVVLQFGVLERTWPPQDARFDPSQTDLMQTVLPELLEARSALFVNLYPFQAWRQDPARVPLTYAQFDGSPCASDGTRCYASLLDAMLDATWHALDKLGMATRLPVVIGEIGWPSGGQSAGATPHDACVFVNRLIAHAAHARTPLGLRVPSLFLFELTDEYDKSTGVGLLGASERHYGLLTQTGDPKYGIDWAPATIEDGALAAARCPPREACSPHADDQCGAHASERSQCFEMGTAFCAPFDNATDAQIGLALAWLCAPADSEGGGGGVDCLELERGWPQCAVASARARAAWAATLYARDHGAAACSFGAAFTYSSWIPRGLADELHAARCPLGVCEATAPARKPPPKPEDTTGGACLHASDCGGLRSSIKSVLVGPTCDTRPLAADAAGSCQARHNASEHQLLSAINWACTVGRVDCTSMAALCASAPLGERATWVFTRFATMHGGQCFFSGAAQLSRVPLARAAPQCNIGECRIPAENLWQSPLFAGPLMAAMLAYAALRLRASRRVAAEWHAAEREPKATGAGAAAAGASASAAAEAGRAAAAGGDTAAGGIALPPGQPASRASLPHFSSRSTTDGGGAGGAATLY